MEMMFGAPSPVWAAAPPYPSLVAPPRAAAGGLATPGIAINSLALNSPPPVYGVDAASLVSAIAVRRGQPQGPVNDQDVEELIYDTLEWLPGGGDVEVRSENGRVTLTGSVPHKRTKRDVGEIAWAIPAVQDVQNSVAIASRRRARPNRDAETPPNVQSRKSA